MDKEPLYTVINGWYVHDEKRGIFGNVYQAAYDHRPVEEQIRELMSLFGKEIYCKSSLHHIGSPCVFCGYEDDKR